MITNKRRPIAFHDNSGFTMVELLVAMAASLILMAAVVGMYTVLTRSYTTETARASVQQDLRAGLALMCQDIQHAGLDPLGTAGGGFTVSSATDIEFIADMDYDGAVTAGNNERVRYHLNGSQLIQSLDNPADPNDLDDSNNAVLLDNVSDLSFVYLDQDGNVTATADEIRSIQIEMTVQAPAGRAGTVARTLTERVRLRNT
ncbi:hypothetical protein DSCW_14980 [Desulfosarcina widdelii]|uniref:Prepilin-type N-terminal cleavage/methylation domain-containing protein n=1 Tax=Desulfosarcina widdelii TaxID=947919 RepID=A0A5K7Z3F1_9BACT|nr:prepilin-type N-terminal cleavage/methylation domain-containing protein [Desulfosarcina widdelii]BBO74081.1 hypothetical protein DSCW_14980 [Desulfosarcina widdelii]